MDDGRLYQNKLHAGSTHRLLMKYFLQTDMRNFGDRAAVKRMDWKTEENDVSLLWSLEPVRIIIRLFYMYKSTIPSTKHFTMQ